MSSPTYPGALPAKRRPSTVTVSSYLLFLAAALIAASAALSLSLIGVLDRVVREQLSAAEADAAAGVMTAIIVGVAVLYLLVAAGLVVLALLNNRGKHPARIVTWVLGGIGACCCGVNAISTAANTAATSAFPVPEGAGQPNSAELQRRLTEEIGGWYNASNLILSAVIVLALLAALILLALPASNEFFRKPRPGAWDAALPGYPGYPPAAPPGPGLPPTGGYGPPPGSGYGPPPVSGYGPPPGSGYGPPPGDTPPTGEPGGTPPTDEPGGGRPGTGPTDPPRS